jgi:hypothetical protein
MKEKGVRTVVVVIVVMVAILVTGAAVYLVTKEGEASQLITKDPSEMVLTLDDLPSDYVIHSEGLITGYENSYFRRFEKTGYYNYISSGIYGFLTTGEAEAFYNSEYNEFSQGENEWEVQSLSETIGDQSFAIHYLSMETESYEIYFRKTNVVAYVNILYEGAVLNDAIGHAFIVENKMG